MFDPRLRQKDFSLASVQTGSGAHPASCPMSTGSRFPAGKDQRGRDADRSPHLVPMLWMSRSYTSSPPPNLPRGVLDSYNLSSVTPLLFITCVDNRI
jgi:hypothetical protein